MIDWELSPAVQQRFNELKIKLEYLQKHFNLRSLTISERLIIKNEREKEKERLQKLIGQRRDIHKWKV